MNHFAFLLSIDGDAVGDADDEAWDYLLLTGKVMYAPVVHSNSRLYLGFETGFGQVDLGEGDIDITVIRPLFGAEYSFQEMPELGFNWEIGYSFNKLETDEGDADINGVTLSLGVHYYF